MELFLLSISMFLNIFLIYKLGEYTKLIKVKQNIIEKWVENEKIQNKDRK